jgi:virginiamycin A acetyltransferase
MGPTAKVFSALTRLHFAWEIEEWGWDIGDHTYGQPRVLDPEFSKLRIGRFCSIGPNVTIVLGNHRTDLVTTYPFKTLAHLWPTAASGEDDHTAKGDVVIHDDVWIGANSMIRSGTEIGPGAVIAGHAVVGGQVPPYAIMAGNPARITRYRFDEPTIDRLLKVAWWNWDEALLRERLPLLMSEDIRGFLDQVEGEGG